MVEIMELKIKGLEPITLLTLITALMIVGCSSVPYAKVGIGYKIEEETITWVDAEGKRTEFDDPITARFELGSWSYGLSHDSQYFTGKPFNNDHEYSKTEICVE